MRVLEHHEHVEKVAHITCGRCKSRLEVVRKDFVNHSNEREHCPWQTTCPVCRYCIECRDLPTFDKFPAPPPPGPMDR